MLIKPCRYCPLSKIKACMVFNTLHTELLALTRRPTTFRMGCNIYERLFSIGNRVQAFLMATDEEEGDYDEPYRHFVPGTIINYSKRTQKWTVWLDNPPLEDSEHNFRSFLAYRIKHLDEPARNICRFCDIPSTEPAKTPEEGWTCKNCEKDDEEWLDCIVKI